MHGILSNVRLCNISLYDKLCVVYWLLSKYVNTFVETSYVIMYPIYSSFLLKIIRISFCKGKFRGKEITKAI